jgi:hypothetical protein
VALQLDKEVRDRVVSTVFYIYETEWSTSPNYCRFFKEFGDRESQKFCNYLYVNEWDEERVEYEFLIQEVPKLPKYVRLLDIPGDLTCDGFKITLRPDHPPRPNTPPRTAQV